MENYVSKPALDPNFVPAPERLFNSYPVNKVELAQITTWLSKGWQDLKSAPLLSLTYGLIFAVVGIVMSVVSSANSAFIVAASTGFLIVGPFLALGLYDLSRQLEQGQKPNLVQSFLSIRHNALGLGLYAIALGMLMIFWVRMSALVVGVSFNETITINEYGYAGLLQGLFSADPLFGLGFLAVGFLFAFLAFITGVVTTPLLLDRKVDIVTAASTSIKAFQKNPVTLLVWGFVVALLIQIGILTYDIGLIVLMPLVAHASWHAYRDIVK